MSRDDFEHQMDFILRQQATFSTDIEQLKDVQKQQATNIDKLTAAVQSLTGNVEAMREEMDANRVDLRRAIDNLIIGNEVTRKLAEDVARLEVGTSQRVTRIEHRVDDMESKQ
jgi:outer membrane murein-binding lipoprotein Lpp